MEVSSQEEMASPQDMKVFAFERHGLPEGFVSYRALCGVQSWPLVFAPNRAIVWGPLQWQAPVEILCLKKNQNAPRPSEHPPVRGKNVKTRSGIIGCKYETSLWHLNGFLYGSTVL